MQRRVKKPLAPAPSAGFLTLKERVCQILRQEIIAGKTPPGTRLVRRGISKRLGVSPIPVIEALHQLEQDGLVESEPMFGHRVRVLTAESMRNDHVLREAIECQSARLCAEHAISQQLEELAGQAEVLDKLVVSDPGGQTHAEKHLDFHLNIARYTGYSALVDALAKLWFRRLMVLNTLTAATLGVPDQWHAQLVKAIRSRDADRAEKAMRKHVLYNVKQQMEDLAKSLKT
ncbi:MAG: GntR family transcriptional regulator [Verrucomicrobiota bacterium]